MKVKYKIKNAWLCICGNCTIVWKNYAKGINTRFILGSGIMMTYILSNISKNKSISVIFILGFNTGAQVLSCVWVLATPWTVPHCAPLPMGSSRQEYWSGLPVPSAGDLPNPGSESWSHALQVDSLPAEPPGKPPYRAPSKPAFHYLVWHFALLLSRSVPWSLTP